MTYVFSRNPDFFGPRPLSRSAMLQITQYLHTFSDNSMRLMHSMNRTHWLILLALAFALGTYWLRGMGGRKDW